ncbi:unnamed protein product [Lathyrus sativus]|nr:unnamed protein product [Lathyrus sativus]
MAAWKSSSPDGFPIGFFQKTWEQTSENICTFIQKTWQCLKIGNKDCRIFHLMFDNDHILFGVATESQIQVVMNTLSKFCYSFGQMINRDKTCIMFFGNTPLSTGRLLIAKAMIKALPTYTMMIVEIAKAYIRKIHQRPCTFIWGALVRKSISTLLIGALHVSPRCKAGLACVI